MPAWNYTHLNRGIYVRSMRNDNTHCKSASCWQYGHTWVFNYFQSADTFKWTPVCRRAHMPGHAAPDSNPLKTLLHHQTGSNAHHSACNQQYSDPQMDPCHDVSLLQLARTCVSAFTLQSLNTKNITKIQKVTNWIWSKNTMIIGTW